MFIDVEPEEEESDAHAAIHVSDASTGEPVGVLIPSESIAGISSSPLNGVLTACTFRTYQTFTVTGILTPPRP